MTLERMKSRLEGFGERHMPKDLVTGRFEPRPVSQTLIDFFQTIVLGQSAPPISVSTMFLALGFLALGIAVLNFVNLATAQAARRARDRRAQGARRDGRARCAAASRGDGAPVAVAFALALGGVELTAALLARRGIAIDLPWGEPSAWLVVTVLAVGAVLCAAAYPAFLLSRVHAVRALQTGSIQGGSRRLRGLLLALQFAAAGFLVIAVTGMYLQNRALRLLNAPSEDRVLVSLDGNLRDADIELDTLRSELSRSPAILGVTAVSSPPWSWSWGGGRVGRSRDGSGASLLMQTQGVSFDFFETLEIEVLAGRVFSRDRAADIASELCCRGGGALRAGRRPYSIARQPSGSVGRTRRRPSARCSTPGRMTSWVRRSSASSRASRSR